MLGGMIEPVAAFGNHLPVRIRFGEGVAASLSDVLRGDGLTRPFLLLDRGLDGIPAIADAIGSVQWVGRYDKEPGEPTDTQVDAVADALRAADVDSVVAIGGGSVMDTAKAARLCADHGGPYGSWAAGGKTYAPATTALVLVPTTAGTGSEVSGGAVITNEATHIKAGIASPHLRAQHALVDPALTYGLPRTQTRDAGIDAMAQAIAGVVVTARTPIGNGIGLEAVRLSADALPAVCADGSNTAARQQMAAASLLGGLVMNISDCGSEHSIGQALGGKFGIPHGLTIGLVLAETMDHDRRAVPELFERVADALGEPDDGSGDGSRAVRGVRRILREIEFPVLPSIGVTEDDLDELAENALKDYYISVAPNPWSHEDVVRAYREALAITAR
jgi:alcohol dehydrogenase